MTTASATPADRFPTFRKWFTGWGAGPLFPDPLFPTFWALIGPRRATRAQRRALLRLIATAAEVRLPLAPLVEAWASDEWGGQRLRLRRLGKALREGTPLPDAVERLPGLLSDDEALLVRFGSESGTLAPTIRRRIESDADPLGDVENDWQRATTYLGIFVCVALPVATFFQITIAPELQKIINEFSVEPTPALRVVRSLGSGLAWLWTLGAVVLLAIVWSRLFDWPGRRLRRTLAPRLFAPVRERRTADVLDQLGQTAALRRPLPGALSTLARYHYDPALRNKLLFVRNEIGLGAGLWPSLTRIGLLSPPEESALERAETVGNRPWVLTSLAEARRRRARRTVAWRSALLTPALAILLGAFVLVQSLNMFLFLTQIVDGLL